MGLGERCDEIVRLIDETLADLGLDPGDASKAGARPDATVTTLAPRGGSKPDRRRRQPPAGPRPNRTAAGF